MNEADILAKTYYDTCTVYRPAKCKLANGESDFLKGTEGEKIHESIPCALARPSGGKLNQTPSTASAPVDYSLFVRPEVDIQANDTVVVLQRGRTVTCISGRADRQLSHNNVPLSLEKETV